MVRWEFFLPEQARRELSQLSVATALKAATGLDDLLCYSGNERAPPGMRACAAESEFLIKPMKPHHGHRMPIGQPWSPDRATRVRK
jgi:hypothetical protein